MIKHPEIIYSAFDSLKWRITQCKHKRAESQIKSDIDCKQENRIPMRICLGQSSFPGWAKMALLGLCVVAYLSGVSYGIYRLLGEVIIPKRNAIIDRRLVEFAQNSPQLADSIACILHNTSHDCDNVRKTNFSNWHELQSRELLLIGARAGDVLAQLHLGKGYESCWLSDWQDPSMPIYHNKSNNKLSRGEYNDLQHAVYWFKTASDAGNMEARGRLGFSYYLGNGCEKLPLAGQRMIKEAADSGLALFQLLYGNILEKGLLGVYVEGDQVQFYRTEPRIDLAKKYWKMAANQGNEVAQLKLEKEY